MDSSQAKRSWEPILEKGDGPCKYVEKGISTSKDRDGNDKSDKLADKGVEEIAGRGLVKLGKWCEARQKQYRKLLVRVQKMIVGVTLAEKEEGLKTGSCKKHC